MKSNLQKLKDFGVMPTTIPKALKTKWLKALRSGNYMQGRSYLYDSFTNRYCCLGVLVKCATNETPPLFKSLPSYNFCKQYNIGNINPIVFHNGNLNPLSYLNDGEKLSFKQIANIIEKQIIGV